MQHSLRYDESLALAELHRAALQVDQEFSFDDIKELVEIVVLVPVILSLDHTQPHDRVVHLAQCLIVPRVPH